MIRHTRLLFLCIVALSAAACGGGSSTSTPSAPPVQAAECDPGDPATADLCGTVYLALTDADGDFLSYGVDVVSLTLETANGRIVETLPRSTRIDFTEYVDLTELFTAATIPPATYVSGSITLDYSNADIHVEKDGTAEDAVVVDASGAPLTTATLDVTLSNRDRLVVTRGRPAFLQLDFDLEASHVIDLEASPVTATSEAFIVAEVTPVDEKTIRVRGPVTDVDVDDLSYTVNIRPFRDTSGEFGLVSVEVTEATEFEVNGDSFTGADGLSALDAEAPGIASVALGVLDLDAREFTASIVLAGSSVPGIDRDAVRGNIIARDGNLLTVRGARVIPRDRQAFFRDTVVVEISDTTRVFKDGDPDGGSTIADLSVGQRVTIRGNADNDTISSSAPEVLFDATAGYVRMHLTSLSGIVNTAAPGEAIIDLQSIDRRRVSIFDFTGTGETDDADPANYEVATSLPGIDATANGKPVVAKGFPTAFGTAPPDFVARTVIDFSGVRSSLGVGWGTDGTTEPFLRLDADGLVLNNTNPDIDQRNVIKQGPVLIDLGELDSGTTVEPVESGRSVYTIKSGDSLRIYTDFADFAGDLALSLDGATAARSMFAYGEYDASANVFTARKLGVFLLEPSSDGGE